MRRNKKEIYKSMIFLIVKIEFKLKYVKKNKMLCIPKCDFFYSCRQPLLKIKNICYFAEN